MPLQFFNYASTVIALPINSSQTTITVADPTQFPLTAGGSCYLTIIDQLSYQTNQIPPAQREIVLVTAIAGNVLTVVRGQDNTSPQAFLIGAQIECRLNAAAIIGLATSGGTYTAPYVGSIPRTFTSKNSDIISAKDFGATGNGATDDTAAIQTAINAASTGTGARVYLPAGTYIVSSPLTINFVGVSLFGDGELATTINTTNATADIIQIGTGTNNPGLNTIAFMSLSSSVVRTAGAAILARNCHHTVIMNITIGGVLNHMFNGIDIRNGANQQFECAIDSFEINGCTNDGISLGLSGGTVSDVRVSNGVIATCGYGIDIYDASGLYFDTIDIINAAAAGVRTFPPAGKLALYMFFSTVLCDTTTGGDGWLFTENGGITSQVTLTGCWASSNFFNGISITGNVDAITMTACQILANQRAGIFLGSTLVRNISINGNQIWYNSMTGVNAYSGIEVTAGVTQFAIVNNFSGRGGSAETVGLMNNQKYGVEVLAGASDKYTITLNQCYGNNTGGVFDGGTGVNKVVANNLS